MSVCVKFKGVLRASHQCVYEGHHVWSITALKAILSARTVYFQNYYVLLIITDGVISDFPDTTRALVMAATLPVSVIIVGVGGADFSAMDALDSDGDLLKDTYGNKARRDIVQFVPMRKFAHVSIEFVKYVIYN